MAGIFALLHYCGMIALVTTLVLFLMRPTDSARDVLIGCTIFFCLSAVISFFKRRHVLCPLCRGAPLVNSRARVHAKFRRIFPFGYGTSATLSLLFTQTFRCMYCGEKFDILKGRPKRRHTSDESPEETD